MVFLSFLRESGINEFCMECYGKISRSEKKNVQNGVRACAQRDGDGTGTRSCLYSFRRAPQQQQRTLLGLGVVGWW